MATTQYVFSKLGDYAKRVVDYVKDGFTTAGYSAEVILSATVDTENILITVDTSRVLTSPEQTTLGAIIQSYVAHPEIIPVTVNSRNIIRVSEQADVDVDFKTITDAVNYVNTEYTDLTRQVTIMVMSGSYVVTSLGVTTGTQIEGHGVVYIQTQSLTMNGEVTLSGLDIVGVSGGPATLVISTSGDVALEHCTVSTSTSGLVAISQNTGSTLRTTRCKVSGYQTALNTSGVAYLNDTIVEDISGDGIVVNQYGQCYASGCHVDNCTNSGVLINGGSGTFSTCHMSGCQNGVMVTSAGTPQLVLNGVSMTGNSIWDMNIEATSAVIISSGSVIDYNKIRNLYGIELLWNSLALTANGYRHVFSGDVVLGVTGSKTRMIVGQGEVLNSLYSVAVQVTSFQVTSVVPYVALRVTFPDSVSGVLSGGTWQYKTLANSSIGLPVMIVDAQTLETLSTGFDMSISRDYYVLLGQIPLGDWNYQLIFTVPNNLSIPSEVVVVPINDATLTSSIGKTLRIGTARVPSKVSLYEHSGNAWYIFKAPNAPLPWVYTSVVPEDVDLSWPLTVKFRYVTKSTVGGNIQWRLRYLFSNIVSDSITQNGTYIQQPIDLVASATLVSSVRTLQTNKVISEQLNVLIPTTSIFATLELCPVTPLGADILLLSVSIEYMAYK